MPYFVAQTTFPIIIFADVDEYIPLLDITYASLAASFNQSLVHHTETLHRMLEMSKNRPWVAQQTEEQRVARERMALFPDKAEVLYVAKDIWVVSHAYWFLKSWSSKFASLSYSPSSD